MFSLSTTRHLAVALALICIFLPVRGHADSSCPADLYQKWRNVDELSYGRIRFRANKRRKVVGFALVGAFGSLDWHTFDISEGNQLVNAYVIAKDKRIPVAQALALHSPQGDIDWMIFIPDAGSESELGTALLTLNGSYQCEKMSAEDWGDLIKTATGDEMPTINSIEGHSIKEAYSRFGL